MEISILILILLVVCVMGFFGWNKLTDIEEKVDRTIEGNPFYASSFKRVRIYRGDKLYHITTEGSQDHREAMEDERFRIEVG